MVPAFRCFMDPDFGKAEDYFGKFLNAMGFDWQNDPAMEGTPRRFVKSYRELFAGKYETLENLTEFPNTRKYSQMIHIKGIITRSMCAHHLLPFFGHTHIAYLPRKNTKGQNSSTILGLSKFHRIVGHYAAKPQTQEELTEEIADAIQNTLQPLAIGVMVECKHLCSCVRGVKDDHSSMITTALRGAMLDNELRQEWLATIK